MPRPIITRNIEAENQALQGALARPEEGGALIRQNQTASQEESRVAQQLLNEQVNMRAYGTDRPVFAQNQPQNQPTAPVSPPVSPTTTPRPVLAPYQSPYNAPGQDSNAGMAYDSNIPKPRTENEIRDEQLKRAQAIIDATESIYQQELGRLTKEGQSRLAQTSSIQVGAGLAGSPFQQTAETQTQQYTTDQLQARKAQRAAEIAKLMAEANDRATEQYDKEIARYQQEREYSMNQQEKDLARKKTLQTEMQRRLSDLAKGGYSIGEIPENDYQRMLSDSGLSDFEARALFSSNSPETSAQYQTSGNKLIQYYFDPRTKETKISSIDIPGLGTEDGLEYNSQLVQGQDGQSYMVFAPKNPKSLEDLQSNTIVKSIGGHKVEGEDELTKSQRTSTFNRIVDSYNRSPLIQASDRTAVLKNTIKEAKKDPNNGAQQLNLVYSYIQALDTYQSAVREGELNLVSSIDSYVGKLANEVQKIKDGKIVRESVVNQIADAADKIVDTIDNAAKNKAQSFRSQATVAGVGDEWNQYISGFNPGYSPEQPQLPKLNKSYNSLDSLIVDHPEYLDVVGQIESQFPNASDGEILQIIEEQNAFSGDLSMSQNGSQAQKIASAIRKVESNGNYQAKGGSGEFGAYQFMPNTWKSWAKKYLGNEKAPLTQENQDIVALAHIQSLLDAGHSPREIALLWNSGRTTPVKGVNSKGVAYDSGAYARKVLKELNS